MLRFFKRFRSFSSADYWEKRYKNGGHSGAGSMHELAGFKAEVLNQAMEDYQIQQVVELGCGDGNQLALYKIQSYIGLDISQTAISLCNHKFLSDPSKRFFIYHPESFSDSLNMFRSDAAISLDVLFHLVEITVYEKYLFDLFAAAKKLVIIYAPDEDHHPKTSHERYRKFTGFITRHFPEWKLDKSIKNRFPSKDLDDPRGSLADFFFYVRRPA
jgi:cyclopropane fatty-acyl-phospholipid synthase-like methyltransferase